QRAQGIEEGARRHVAAMKEVISLTPDQEDKLAAIYAQSTRTKMETLPRQTSGAEADEAMATMRKLSRQEDAEAEALLTPEQLEAWRKYNDNKTTLSARVSANRTADQLKYYLDLTPAQADQAFPIIFELAREAMTSETVKNPYANLYDGSSTNPL